MEKLKKDKSKEPENKPENKSEKKIEELEFELEKAHADEQNWKNEYYRAYADTQNLRKTLEKEHSQALKYRSEGFIEELLPVLDSFHVALEKEPEDPTLKNYLVGFQFIYRNLVSALENEGVKEISPKIGDKFDATNMNAVDTVEDEGEENIIKRVCAKGYMLHDRLVRPANVIVSAKPKQKEEKTKEN